MRSEIYFVSTFPPIICGVGDYTKLLIEQIPKSKVISFNPQTFGSSTQRNYKLRQNVSYLIENPQNLTAEIINESLKELGNSERAVLIFQDSFAWEIPNRFAYTLKQLNHIKIISHHGIHFQSKDTPAGLEKREKKLLELEFDYIDCVISFTHGAYDAITRTFPEHESKVTLIRHGIPIFTEINRLSEKEAREEFFEFLLHKSDLKEEQKRTIENRFKELTDNNTPIIGYYGFIGKNKGMSIIYSLAEKLREKSGKKVIALYVGGAREEEHEEYARAIELQHNDKDDFCFITHLPDYFLNLAIKSSINIFWPENCTQSGRLARVFGLEAIALGRDIEGLGETLKLSRYPACNTFEDLIEMTMQVIMEDKLKEKIREEAKNQVKKYSFEEQAKKHVKLAEILVENKEIPKFDFNI